MTKPLRILLHNDITDDLVEMLRAAEPDVSIETCHSYDALPETLSRFRPEIVYTIRFGGMKGFPRAALLGPHGPRWIANGGVGFDHLGTWKPERVTITNAAGVAAEMMAEYVLGGFLHFTIDVPGLIADKSDRIWRARSLRPLKGATLLILGLGNTGQAIAARAKAFGMTVIGTRATPRPMPDVDEVHGPGALSDLLPRADFIAVATPLTGQTRGLLNAARFAEVKRGVVLADVSRGGVIDHAALRSVLASGQVAGAILDVFEEEPLAAGDPMWQADNVVISPHCSSVFDGWAQASFAMFLDNLRNWRAGRPLFNVVDPEKGY